VTVAILEELTKLGVDVTGKFETWYGMVGLSFLYANMGLVDELRYILDQGGNVEDSREYYNQTPLHRAAICHTKVVSLLLDRGADIEAEDHFNGGTSLHIAAICGQTEILTLLLDRGADIDAKGNGGETALHWATKNGKEEIAEILRDRGAEDAD